MFIHKLIFFLIFTAPFLFHLESNAQITPDNSNGIQTGVINDSDSIKIIRGRRFGNVLLHQFQDFNIDSNQVVSFEGARNINTVIAEVTSERLSRINGVLGSKSGENFILINPNGSIFGEGASLNLNGSLTVSTSNSLSFDNSEIKLGFLNNSNNIRILGRGHNRMNPGDTRSPNIFENNQPPIGLRVKDGHSINLIAGGIILSGGVLTTPSGNIEIIAIRDGQVSLTPSNSSSLVPSILSKATIELNNLALLNASGSANGNILLQGKDVILDDAALLFVENFGDQPLGEILIDANTVSLSGLTQNVPFLPGLATVTRGISSVSNNAKSSDIRITANSLQLNDQANIVSYTEGLGKGANIYLEVDNINLEEQQPFNEFFPISSFIGSISRGRGDSGLININSTNLSISNGSAIQTVSLDRGNGGDLSLNIAEQLSISGISPSTLFPSVLAADTAGTVNNSASGNAGSISIKAGKVNLTNGGRISSSTFDDGNSGNITIEARQLAVTGQKGNFNSEIIASSEFLSSPLANVLDQTFPTGDSGAVSIEADSLILSENGSVTVRSDNTGNAGNIDINVPEISIEDNASILASTNGGNGGSVNISTRFLNISSGVISASTTNEGVGGNININSIILGARESSVIEANAENNQAGNVFITSDAIFSSNESSFTASSEQGPLFAGTVQLNQTQNQVTFLNNQFVDNTPSQLSFNACTNDGSTLSQHGSGNRFNTIRDKQLYAEGLKQRLAIANQFTYTDSSGKEKPFRRWLGVQQKEDGELEMVFSPEQSKVLQNLLSSDTSRCSHRS